MGRWVGEQVLGGVGRALVERAPVTVRVELPAGAEVLAYRPLEEVGWVDGRPVGAQDVDTAVVSDILTSLAEQPDGEPAAKEP